MQPPSTGSGAGWRNWLILAGRGYGKTRTGAEWVLERARGIRARASRWLAGASTRWPRSWSRARAGCWPARKPARNWCGSRPSASSSSRRCGGDRLFRRQARTGCAGRSTISPGADEIAKWLHPDAAWDNLQIGIAAWWRSRAVATTTPRPIALICAAAGRCGHQGSTARADVRQSAFAERVRGRDEAHLRRVAAWSAGAGRRVVLGEAEGALWTREVIEQRRCAMPRREEARAGW